MALIIKDISKTYNDGTQALRNLSFSANSGTIGLLGPNGSGKTTLMRILATLLPPSSGDVEINGIPLTNRLAIRDTLGYLPQKFGFYPRLTVWETLIYFGHLKGIHSRKRLEELLDLVGLTKRRKTRVQGLSGGMRQRLGIAVALLNDPKFLIVDEPTAGLDPEGRLAFRNLLTTLPGERTVLLSSHIVEDIAQSATQLAVLYKGDLLFTGSPLDLCHAADGHVWQAEISQIDLPKLEESHLVVSTVREDDRLRVRCIGPKRAGFLALSPTLEDGYMTLLRGKRK